jgi:hypothetical protein
MRELFQLQMRLYLVSGVQGRPFNCLHEEWPFHVCSSDASPIALVHHEREVAMYQKTRHMYQNLPGLVRQRMPIYVAICCLIIVLAACGSLSTKTGSSSPNKSTTATAAVSSTVTATGCPGGINTNASTAPADVTLTQSDSKPNSEGVPVKKGATVEFQLAQGHAWKTPTIDPQGLLQPTGSEGYISATDHTCNWRYVAANIGTEQVNFEGGAICTPGQACPLYLIVASFTLEIQ